MSTGVLSRTSYTHFGIDMMQITLLCCLQPEARSATIARRKSLKGPVVEKPHFSPSFLQATLYLVHRRRGLGPLCNLVTP